MRNTFFFFCCILSGLSSSLPLAAQEGEPTRIAFSSCIGSVDTARFRTISQHAPSAVLFLGDNIYLHSNKIGKSQDRTQRHAKSLYRKLNSDPDFFALRSQIPTFAIWDDHDFGPNNSDASFAHRAITRVLFENFWKMPPPVTDKGIYRSTEVGNTLVLLTDNRSFRIPGETLLGNEQLDWMERKIEETPQAIIVIASGGQLLTSGSWHENYGEFPEEQQRFFKMLSRVSKPVIILSGDRHFADLIDRRVYGKSLLEATSSPLSGGVADEFAVEPNPGRKGIFLGANFGLLTLPQNGAWAQIEIIEPSGETTLRYTKALDSLQTESS